VIFEQAKMEPPTSADGRRWKEGHPLTDGPASFGTKWEIANSLSFVTPGGEKQRIFQGAGRAGLTKHLSFGAVNRFSIVVE